ncbi:hypothetical protein [Mesorhizobium sp. WSM4884]|uniref:hypothetical protein n=1 Tax=Mesorhizobium sp. WSM4884 TaxID=3038542 RepID=UPI002415CB46|nr:hypothetical protein [Mesorhizobium sp. WSM4884]MDG4884166.1 hypothetical protein [Mesorhizobium sp. WSM4884]
MRCNIDRDNRGLGACPVEDAIILTRVGISLAGKDRTLGSEIRRQAAVGFAQTMPPGTADLVEAADGERA